MSESEIEKIAYSKITNTAVPYKDRWNDALYKKEYVRWWRHEVKGLKRRPTRNLDGSLYKDTHPEYQFTDYYKHAEMWKCDVCEVSMTEGMKKRHLNSKRHSNNIQRKQVLFQIEKKNRTSIHDEICALRDSTDNQRFVCKVYSGIIQSAQQAV